jgi:hypothetical protein
MKADYEKYKHLIFNGTLPEGYKFFDFWAQGNEYYFIAAPGSIDNVFKRTDIFIVLLDSGLLVFANYGNGNPEYLDKNNIFIGYGVIHKGICKC